MKKLFYFALILTLIAVVCCPFQADDAFAAQSFEAKIGGHSVNFIPLTNGGQAVGVRFSGMFFGHSGISLDIDVYNSPIYNVGEVSADNEDLMKLFTRVVELVDKVDACANTGYNGSESCGGVTSDIYRYNMAKQGEQIPIDKHTYKMLTYAREMYDVTNHAFNPAVYRLVDLWGFSSRIYSANPTGLEAQVYDRSFDGGYVLPDDKYVQAFSEPAFTDFSDEAVTLSEQDGQYFVTKNVAPAVVDGVQFDQWLDLGGIAKGYATDLIKDYFVENGIDRYYINAGTSSISMGYEWDGGKTNLAIADSMAEDAMFFPTALLSLDLCPCSISTSGQYIRKYVADGVEYAHIIDADKGAPAQTGIVAVTVIARRDNFWATKGDCLTTAMTVMGRDGIVSFINGYLKEQGVDVIVQYKTLDGQKQILTNMDPSKFTAGANYDNYGMGLEKDADGNYFYVFDEVQTSASNVLLIVLGCVLGAVVIVLVVVHFAFHRKRTVTNVRNAKKDKPFKLADILVYMLVLAVIAVLFVTFVFNTNNAAMQTVNVVDEQTGETLFIYGITRDETYINENNSRNWKIQVTKTENGLTVRLEKDFDGEVRFNELTITLGKTASVKMTNSLCGFHQDCVRNFPEITRAGGVIVCSPNRLKVVTE